MEQIEIILLKQKCLEQALSLRVGIRKQKSDNYRISLIKIRLAVCGEPYFLSLSDSSILPCSFS